MKKSYLIGLSLLAFAGCVSIEEQLASPDPTIRAKGHQRAVDLVLNSNASRTERLAVIAKLGDKESILKILTEYDKHGRSLYWERELQKPDFYKACIDKLDQRGLYEYLAQDYHVLGYNMKEDEAARYEEEKGRYALSRLTDTSILSEIYGYVDDDRHGGRMRKGMKPKNAVAMRLNRFDVLAHVASHRLWKDIQSPEMARDLLLCACDGGKRYWYFQFENMKGRTDVLKALSADRFSAQDRLALAKKVTSDEIVQSMLNYAVNGRTRPEIHDRAVAVALSMNVDEATRCKIAAEMIDDQFSTNWNQNDLYPMLNAAALAETCSVSTKYKLCRLMLARIEGAKGSCYVEPQFDESKDVDPNVMAEDFKAYVLKQHWSSADEERINLVMKAWLPLFRTEDMRDIIVSGEKGCSLLLPYVKGEKMMLDLYKNVDSARMRMYFATKISKKDITADLCRKEDNPKIREFLLLRGGSEVRTAFEGKQNRDLKPFLQRAESASKTTFSFQGFYLGMDVNDAFALVRESVADGEAKVHETSDGAKIVVVVGQSTPFCRADKAGKVFRFDFGRQWLDKWFQSKSVDAATLAAEYGQHFGVKLENQTLTRRIDVHERELSKEMGFGTQPPQGRSWYHELIAISQDAYDGICDAKKYKVTYYGKKVTRTEGCSPQIGASSQGLAGAIEQGVNGIASSLWTKLVSMKIVSETENVMSDEGVLRVEKIP